MKKIIILTLLLSLKLSAQEIPQINDIPYYTSGDAELQAQGYTNTPKNYKTIDLYTPSYDNKTSEYVKNLSKNQNTGQEYNGGTLEKIIEDDKNKINISGGYAKIKDTHITEDDGTLKPKYEEYKPGVNNEEYNIVIREQERKKDLKNVKNTLEDLLPLTLMFVLIIAVIYLIIFLRKKIQTNPF